MDKFDLLLVSNVITVLVCTAINKTDIAWIKQGMQQLRDDIQALRDPK
ncbi:hypothetical protein FIU82_07625 [Pseudoalteromonas sp. THAF3]|nr:MULTISPECIES: hypothetical protein [unclassified Pseudoalteromonas]QFU04882.1 hypothetical protein FIU82_07625 [Pseudoalteromonas sp. THAF3]GAP76757.1 hypothetical protein W04_3329 [Pseudoalteromonas sp. SW0106-04]|tara:strand:- start:2425 stop:2568 length:144 start_codon:yes stop_codon:yes gene_type:complete